ncbi:MAG: hypothetical protein ABEI52_09780, partial [Halobacteriaceae archaeon]
GARIQTIPGANPTFRCPEHAIKEPLGDAADRASDLLERFFWLDALARTGMSSDPPPKTSLLETVNLDPAAINEMSASRRFKAYLECPFDRIAERLPSWHLAFYTTAKEARARTLPAVLDRLAHVHPADARPLTGKDLLSYALGEFYRAERPSVVIDSVRPSLRDERLHGWLAPEIPVDAFKIIEDDIGPSTRPPTPPVDIALVQLDPAMANERQVARETYREYSVPVNVTEMVTPTRNELRTLLESDTDQLHVIGHCEPDGFECVDGYLDTGEMDHHGVTLFILNACGSYDQGVGLIRAGASAGVVTHRRVLDDQATSIGSEVAQYLGSGFCLERALQFARKGELMGIDYAVIGDGTRRLVNHVPSIIEPAGDATAGDRAVRKTFAEGGVGQLLRPKDGRP